MKTVKFNKNYLTFKKGKLYNVTSRHAGHLAASKTAEIIEDKEKEEKKEDKEAASRKTK